jgi:hypothetical protein
MPEKEIKENKQKKKEKEKGYGSFKHQRGNEGY